MNFCLFTFQAMPKGCFPASFWPFRLRFVARRQKNHRLVAEPLRYQWSEAFLIVAAHAGNEFPNDLRRLKMKLGDHGEVTTEVPALGARPQRRVMNLST